MVLRKMNVTINNIGDDTIINVLPEGETEIYTGIVSGDNRTYTGIGVINGDGLPADTTVVDDLPPPTEPTIVANVLNNSEQQQVVLLKNIFNNNITIKSPTIQGISLELTPESVSDIENIVLYGLTESSSEPVLVQRSVLKQLYTQGVVLNTESNEDPRARLNEVPINLRIVNGIYIINDLNGENTTYTSFTEPSNVMIPLIVNTVNNTLELEDMMGNTVPYVYQSGEKTAGDEYTFQTPESRQNEVTGNELVYSFKNDTVNEMVVVVIKTADGDEMTVLNSGEIVPVVYNDNNSVFLKIYCVHGMSVVDTDKGPVCIKDISSKLNYKVKDIHGNYIPLKYIIRTNKTNKFIRLSKNSIGNNIPDQDLYIKHNHPIFINNEEVLPIKIINSSTIKQLTIEEPDYLYTLCTEHRTFVLINNVPVATWSEVSWLEEINNPDVKSHLYWTKL